MTNKRIGFDGRYINDRYHGIGRYAFRLIEAMATLDQSSTFIIFRGKSPDTRFDWGYLASIRNIEIHDGPWPLYWPQEQLAWPALIRRHRIDAFHTPYFVAPLFIQRFSGNGKSSLPVIITIHDLIFDRYPKYMPIPISHPYYRLLMRLSTHSAQNVITVSQSTAGDLNQYYHTPFEKITVIPEGVDQSFRPVMDTGQMDTLRRRYQLDNPFILNVGARRPHKNISTLIEAFAYIAPITDYVLVIAGPNDHRFPNTMEQYAADLNLSDRIRFLDWIPETELPGLYSLADMVVLPSFIEGFGLPALEAMACGTPVIAADNTSYPEVVGSAGILIDPHSVTQLAHQIHQLVEKQDRRNYYREVGLRQAAAFTWERAASATLQAYQKALA
jgi:alpha-1,3-rhamnosyl/mannosyltransferase